QEVERAAQLVDWVAVAPPLIVAVTAVLVLLADLWLPRRWSSAVTTGVAATGVVAALAAVALSWGESRATFCVTGPGALESYSYAANELTLVFQGVVLVGTLVVLLLAQSETARDDDPMPAGETG